MIKVRNVYVLPGSPIYFRPAADQIVGQLKRGRPLHSATIDVNLDELALLEAGLDKKAQHWQGTVTIGSYPQSGFPTSRTRLTVEGHNKATVKKAKQDLESMLPKDAIVGKTFDLNMAKKLYQAAEDDRHVKNAFEVLKRCYEQ